MTLSDIENRNKEFLIPSDIAEILGCDKYSINKQAQTDASKLGFPVVVMGTRVRIPKQAFIKFCKGELMTKEV